MVELIKMLDSVRAEQCKAMRHDGSAEGRRLHAIEAYLDRHEGRCATCRQVNPHGTHFVESSSRRGSDVWIDPITGFANNFHGRSRDDHR